MRATASHHAVLRIVDAAVEAASPALAVERQGEVAEGVGGVRAPVVHRVRAQHRVLVVVLGAIEPQRIEAGGAFPGLLRRPSDLPSIALLFLRCRKPPLRARRR